MPNLHHQHRRKLQAAFALVAILLLTIVALPATSFAKDEIKPLKEFSGTVAIQLHILKRPRNGVVTKRQTWVSLCKAWRPDQEIPQIDFKKNIVIVEIADGPNTLLPSSLFLAPNGDLRFELSISKEDGDGFGYLMLVVPKSKIVSINTKPIDRTKINAIPKPSPPAANATSANDPETTTETAARPPTNTAGPAPPTGSVKVEINGLVRTGIIMKEGGTSLNSAMVSAAGIVWDLDFQNDANLILAAKSLGNKFGTIKGRLIKITNPNGVSRKVVMVESIALSAQQPSPYPASPQIAGQQTAPLSIPPATPPSMTELPSQQQSPNVFSPAAPITAQSFRSLAVKMTRGVRGDEQTQTVSADGIVVHVAPAQNHSDTYNLSPSDLANLHNLIAKTDWNSIPSNSRIPRNALRFEFSIETNTGSKRLEVDATAIKDKSSVFAKMFGFMGRPKS